ncbi:hypothetical protein NQ317_011460 [Molorchus minor]|uniref:Uncharacterized protein n=1 Tax=Molorchus minor TaxID=1323400 RepID=A0ABQ9JLQ4_9CUCU|nr:hypothetical protein NQ317_011460 [Molorchus minor]
MQFCVLRGSRHQTPDTADERVTDLPPRYFGGPRGRGRRDLRRDDRRRTTDDEETVLDSQDVSSADRVNNHVAGASQEASQNDTRHTDSNSKPQRDQKNRSNKPPPARRNEAPKHNEALVNGTTT